MEVQPFTIDNESEANAYLSDLLKHPENQTMNIVEQRCAALIKDPAIKAYFLAAGANMLTEIKGRS